VERLGGCHHIHLGNYSKEKINKQIIHIGLRRPLTDNGPLNNQLKIGVDTEEEYG